MDIFIINGPNLNLLGKRKPEIYGTKPFGEFLEELRNVFTGIPIGFFQTNHEGSIIDKLHEIGYTADGIILNAGAYAHTSIAIRDAIETIETPVIEVHISDIYAREEFRRKSMIGEACAEQIVGHGLEGYREAIAMLLTGNVKKPR